MNTYVLVHGAWEGAWSWDETRAVLEKHGHEVVAVALPGTRENERAIGEVTFESYVETVADAIRSRDNKVILVGHSLAGAVISQVAEVLPGRIDRLVYAAGFLLSTGDSVLAAMQRDNDGEFLPGLTFSEDQTTASAHAELWKSKAFHDVGEGAIARVLPLVADRLQATEPFMAKVSLTAERFGGVEKVYIRTSLDKMVSPKLQDEMLKTWPVAHIHTLPAGHFPTLSMPDKLAELMM